MSVPRSQAERLLGSLAVVGLVLLVASGPVSAPARVWAQEAPPAAGTLRLTGHRAAILSQAKPTAPIAGSQTRTLAVVLAPSDPAGFAAYEQATSDPASPSYQQWLTPAAWSAQFGPTTDTEAAVVSFLQQGGLTIEDEASNLQVIRASGTVGAIDQLFQITLTRYELPGGRRLPDGASPCLRRQGQ